MNKSQNRPGRYQSRRRSKKWLIVGILLVLIAATAVFVYIKKHDNPEAQTTSKSKTAQSDYSSGKPRKTDGQSTGNSQGGATDNKGKDTGGSTGDEAKISSDNGAISVLGVAQNSLLADAQTLHGTANKEVSQVQFRIIDETVGMVAQGQLSVVNGAYSGTLHFTSKSSTGRLDVYSFDAAGDEINNIEIPVRFK